MSVLSAVNLFIPDIRAACAETKYIVASTNNTRAHADKQGDQLKHAQNVKKKKIVCTATGLFHTQFQKT